MIFAFTKNEIGVQDISECHPLWNGKILLYRNDEKIMVAIKQPNSQRFCLSVLLEYNAPINVMPHYHRYGLRGGDGRG